MSVDILQVITNKLTIYGITWDEPQINLILDETDQFIRNYCHIDNIPDELVYVRSNMTVDYIRNLEGSKPLKDDEELDIACSKKTGPLTLISSGDVTYQFGSVQASRTNVANAHTVDLDSLFLNYKQQLDAFRRLVW